MKKKKKNMEAEKTVELDANEIALLFPNSVLVGSSSVIGTRENQQDAFFVTRDSEKEFSVAVVCDGMGGLTGGEIASNTAINYIKEHITADIEEEKLIDDLYRTTIDANELIRELKNEDGNPLGAGTTMVMTVIKDGRLNWAAVGDSKIYLLRNDELVTLTNEHNYSFMVERKKDDDDFVFNPNTRPDALVSYLGAPKLQYIDINAQPLELADGDVLILCSDGLYKNLNEEQIKVMFLSENQDMQRLAEMLTTAAGMAAAGTNQDNTTVVVLKYKQNAF